MKMNKSIILIAFLSFAFPATAVIGTKQNFEGTALLQSRPPEVTTTLSTASETPLILALHRSSTRSVPPGGQNTYWGKIKIPDGLQVDCTDPANCIPIFTQSLEFQAMVRDPEMGNRDGVGIESVKFEIQNSGGIVYAHTEKQAGYCPFGGGEPHCNTFVFARNHNQWPDGSAITNDDYTANITIFPRNGDRFKWIFNFKIQLPNS
jgi:hypothetical protein